jgi:hypothetical protein
VGELGLDRLRLVDADARALLRPGLGQDERPAALERQPEGRCLGPLAARLDEAQPTRAHEVHVQDELAVVGREEEVLAAAARARQPPALEGRERRLDRLQRRDVGRPGSLDRSGCDRLVECATPRFDLWQLRNLVLPVGGPIRVAVERGGVVESIHLVGGDEARS